MQHVCRSRIAWLDGQVKDDVIAGSIAGQASDAVGGHFPALAPNTKGLQKLALQSDEAQSVQQGL